MASTGTPRLRPQLQPDTARRQGRDSGAARQPDHPALLGPWRGLLAQTGHGADMPPPGPGLPDEQLTALDREVLGLLHRHGPFALGWLEDVMRAADQRACADATLADPVLKTDHVDHGRPGDHPPLAGTARSGEAPPPLGKHPAQRGAQHGAGRRADGSGAAGGRTRAPAHATRYLETQLGRLSYLELARHMARAAAQVEVDIQAGLFDDWPLDAELILELHRQLCAHLTPQLAGWRGVEVLVGTHTPRSCPGLIEGREMPAMTGREIGTFRGFVPRPH